MSDRQRAEGHGIRLGDFELHPGIGAEVGWVSNVLLSTPEQASAALRVTPHLYLSTLGAERLEGSNQKVGFRTGVSGSFRDYFQTKLKPNVAIGQDMQLSLMPSSVFRMDLFDEYQRTIDPFTGMPSLSAAPGAGGTGGTPTQAATLTVPNYSRDKIGVGTRLQLSTPGQLFRVGAGYRFDADLFEDNVFAGNKSLQHTISSDTSWEFLPQTALVWNGSVRLHDWLSAAKAGAAGGSRVNGTLVDSKIGLNGALTPRVGLTIAGGYSAGFYRDNNDYEGVIAQVSGRWKIQENALWTLGYDRQFNVSFQGSHVRTDRLSTSLQATFSGAFLMALRAAFAFVTFGTDPTLNARTDRNLQLNLNGEYRFVDWLALTGEVGYIQNFTNYQFPPGALSVGGQTLTYDPKYKQIQVWGGIRAFL